MGSETEETEMNDFLAEVVPNGVAAGLVLLLLNFLVLRWIWEKVDEVNHQVGHLRYRLEKLIAQTVEADVRHPESGEARGTPD